jgi:hypothetical protein
MRSKWTTLLALLYLLAPATATDRDLGIGMSNPGKRARAESALISEDDEGDEGEYYSDSGYGHEVRISIEDLTEPPPGRSYTMSSPMSPPVAARATSYESEFCSPTRIFHGMAGSSSIDSASQEAKEEKEEAKAKDQAHWLGKVQLGDTNKTIEAFTHEAGQCCKKQCVGRVSLGAVALYREHVATYGASTATRLGVLESAQELFIPDVYLCSKSKQMMLGNKSTHWIHPRSKQCKEEANRQRASKSVSVYAWFCLLIPTLDQMPDEAWFLVSAPDKASVHDWYKSDVERWPDSFVGCSRPYFLACWREGHLKNLVRLRKFTRFTKCGTCLELKEQKKKHGHLSKVDPKVKQRLIEHYLQIKRYRAHAMMASLRAKVDPECYISIAQDGTEQMGFGYPSTPEFKVSCDTHARTHAQDSLHTDAPRTI